MSQRSGQHLTNWTRWNNRDKVWSGTNSLFKWRFRNHRRCCCLSSLYSASYKRNRNAAFSRSQPPTPLKTITTPTPFLMSRRLRLYLHLRWAISHVYFLEFAFVSQARIWKEWGYIYIYIYIYIVCVLTWSLLRVKKTLSHAQIGLL